MPSLRTLPRDLRLFAKYHLKRRVYDHPARETELGVVSLDFDLDAYVARLEGFADRFDVEPFGEVSYRGRAHPIMRVASRAPAAKTVLVLAGVHGNEHAGLLAVPEILERHSASDARLVVVTPVNPVGAAELSRYNGQGYDINRDFVRFDTLEARRVRAAIELDRPDFIVSLHEGPQDRTFMFANRHVEARLASRLLAAMEAGGTDLATSDYLGRTLTPPGLAPTGTAGWLLGWLWARSLSMMTTGMYADDRAIPELTLESSWRLDDPAARVRAHVDLVGALLAELG